ncbi:MAG TPA: S41 family peptidase [Chitinophagaceae bacterium]|nr:S41 family peptidase [Chitinophagaceae bacterium]
MKTHIYHFLPALCICLAVISSCKKVQPSSGNSTPTDSATLEANARDTALSASRDFYLWYQNIPSSFNAQSYADPNAVMVAIRAYSDEPGYTSPVDKWSFGVLKADWNQLSGGIGSANSISESGDFGFSVFFRVDGDLRVKLVERLSPAGLAGVQRGWRVLKINGSSDITIANSDFIVNAVFYSATSTFTFQKPDGTTVDMTLNATTYQQQPVYLDTIYHIGAKTIGYVVINYFLGDTTQNIADYGNVMNHFASNSVTDIVVDIRYNGGGYVSLQQKLADYLAPNSTDRQLMMKETFNDKHQDYNTSLYFNKTGPLNPDHVTFIVSQATASASELLINNLRPYMTVKLIGPANTDGKPVGFFPISAGDWYVFPISFRSENSAGYGGYFNGFTPDAFAADGLDKNWGDTSESCLAEAIKYVTTGTFIAQPLQAYKPDPSVLSANRELDQHSFKGMIDARMIK